MLPCSGEEKGDVRHQEVAWLCQLDGSALCSLEEGTLQSQSKEACCIGRLNVGVSEGWSKVHLSMVCAERGKRCELCGESDRCQEVVGDVDPEEVCGDLEEMGSVDLVI